ncbi:hypothetical protein D3C80_691560 [compost metagenome]
MNQQLTISNQNNGLSPTQQEYSIAMKGKLVHIMKPFDLELEMIDLVTLIYLETGKRIEDSEEDHEAQVSILGQRFANELKLHFRFLTIDEVKLAVHKGLRKAYGEYYGVSTITFHNWLSAFQMDKKRIETIQLEQKQNEPKKPELTPEEQKSIIEEGVLRSWNWYKKTKEFNELKGGYHTLTCFDYLHDNKIANFTYEQKVKFGKEARKNVKERLTKERLKAVGNEVSLREIANDLKIVENEPKSILVINEAKKLALQSFYNELIEMEVDLEDLLNGKN